MLSSIAERRREMERERRQMWVGWGGGETGRDRERAGES